MLISAKTVGVGIASTARINPCSVANVYARYAWDWKVSSINVSRNVIIVTMWPIDWSFVGAGFLYVMAAIILYSRSIIWGVIMVTEGMIMGMAAMGR